MREELHDKLGVVPEVTRLDDKVLSADQMAHTVTDGYEWTEFDLSPDGSEAWGPSRDPDARPETRVKYVKLEVLIDLIHKSLAHGQAVVWGSPDHALLIYGGDYDKDGTPLSYLIKDLLRALHLSREGRGDSQDFPRRDGRPLSFARRSSSYGSTSIARATAMNSAGSEQPLAALVGRHEIHRQAEPRDEIVGGEARLSNRMQTRPLFASNNDPPLGVKTR